MLKRLGQAAVVLITIASFVIAPYGWYVLGNFTIHLANSPYPLFSARHWGIPPALGLGIFVETILITLLTTFIVITTIYDGYCWVTKKPMNDVDNQPIGDVD